jgi:hypothetical protein
VAACVVAPHIAHTTLWRRRVVPGVWEGVAGSSSPATARSECLVRPAVPATAARECVLTNAGHAPWAVVGPVPRPQIPGSRSRLVAPLRPATRGRRVSGVGATGLGLDGRSQVREIRATQVSDAGEGQIRSRRFAGQGVARPAFGLTGYFSPIVVGERRAEVAPDPAGGEQQGGPDLGRDTSRQTKAGSRIRRGARDCRYTP